jgi:hypothetical protein
MMILELELQLLMQMRGFGVVWSPDSPGSDAMKTRTEPGNPGARHLKLIKTICR